MCLAAGMDDYVSKPIRIEELVEALSRSRPLTEHQEPEAPPVIAPVVQKVGTRRDPDETGTAEATDLPAGAALLDPTALENLLSMLGGEFEFLVELIDSFLEDAPQLLIELEQHVKAGDAAGVRQVAHSLKSNGADFGATTFSNLCKELEMIGRSGTVDGAADLAAQIVAEYERVEAALTAIRRAGTIRA
jgi:HPt (histidine-containing phosphotransfer) domain-containing protein